MSEAEKTICMICKKECKNLLSLATHIRRSHHISAKEYYNRFLKKPDEGICPITGKATKFLGLREGYQRYYDRKAAGQSEETREKFRNTCRERYDGIDHPFKVKEIQQKYRNTCLKKYNVTNPCQTKGVLKKREQTNLEKYGTKCSLQNDEVRKKSERTMLEKYGITKKATLLNPEIRQKFQLTNLQRYGTKYPFQSKKIQEKYKQTCIERFGVKNPSQLETIKEKIKRTNLKKFGVENSCQNEEIKAKIKQTCLEKFGVTNPMQSVEVREKSQQTCLKKYGVPNPCQNNDIKRKISETLIKRFLPKLDKQLCELKLKLIDDQYQHAFHSHQWKCLKCQQIFTESWFNIYQGYRCPKCYPRQVSTSRYEQELANFLESLELEVIRNDRQMIKPYELDVVIPTHKLSIEFDGIYWHSEQTGIGKYYHLRKTDMCEEKGHQLIHIFEDEWILKKNIVKSRLKHILNKTEDCIHIGARECIIQELSSEQKNEFLERFHIQGKDSSTVKLGAFYQNQLVAVMTFSHGSLAKGVKHQDPLIWELNRFCTHSDFVISGIASKLLAYFKRNYKWEQIFSYADRRWSSGNLYEKLGFQLDHKTQPNYWYTKGFGRIHRFNLKKRPDEPKDIPEYILRLKEGYTRIWDCGNLKFALENNVNEKGD